MNSVQIYTYTYTCTSAYLCECEMEFLLALRLDHARNCDRSPKLRVHTVMLLGDCLFVCLENATDHLDTPQDVSAGSIKTVRPVISRVKFWTHIFPVPKCRRRQRKRRGSGEFCSDSLLSMTSQKWVPKQFILGVGRQRKTNKTRLKRQKPSLPKVQSPRDTIPTKRGQISEQEHRARLKGG